MFCFLAEGKSVVGGAGDSVSDVQVYSTCKHTSMMVFTCDVSYVVSRT